MEQDCPYSAKKSKPPLSLFHTQLSEALVYLDSVSRGNTHWPVSTVVDGIPDIENITDALHNGPYGQCVYESDNDVCDHQVW
jgi:hypothetical protein